MKCGWPWKSSGLWKANALKKENFPSYQNTRNLNWSDLLWKHLELWKIDDLKAAEITAVIVCAHPVKFDTVKQGSNFNHISYDVSPNARRVLISNSMIGHKIPSSSSNIIEVFMFHCLGLWSLKYDMNVRDSQIYRIDECLFTTKGAAASAYNQILYLKPGFRLCM